MTAGLWYLVGFSLMIGAVIPAFWIQAVGRGDVPEIAEGKKEIWFHIAAEVATGLVLIVAGAATWATGGSRWTEPVCYLGLGLLLYTATVSPGYYVDRREWPMVVMFGVVWIGAVAAVAVRLTA